MAIFASRCPIIVTSIAAALGSWRAVFYLLAIPGLLGIVLLYYFISDKPEDMLRRGKLSQSEYEYIHAGLLSDEGSSTKLTLTEILKDVSLWLWAMQQFFLLAVYWGSTAWLTSFLYEQHGLNLRKMGMMASVPYVLAFIATIMGGVLMDKVFHRTKPVALISFITSIPILMYISHVPKGQTGTLIVMLMLTGFFVNLAWGVVNAYPQVRYPQEVVGKVVGITICIGQMGAFISPLVAGYLVETTPTGVSYNKVFLMFAICSALGALVTCFLKEGTYKTDKQDESKKTVCVAAG
jgi:sugar phosphate permease